MRPKPGPGVVGALCKGSGRAEECVALPLGAALKLGEEQGQRPLMGCSEGCHDFVSHKAMVCGIRDDTAKCGRIPQNRSLWDTKRPKRRRLLMLRRNTQAETNQRDAGESFEHAPNPPPAEDLAQLGDQRGIGREPREGHDGEYTAAKEQS
jgi:hypothetical protein